MVEFGIFNFVLRKINLNNNVFRIFTLLSKYVILETVEMRVSQTKKKSVRQKQSSQKQLDPYLSLCRRKQFWDIY